MMGLRFPPCIQRGRCRTRRQRPLRIVTPLLLLAILFHPFPALAGTPSDPAPPLWEAPGAGSTPPPTDALPSLTLPPTTPDPNIPLSPAAVPLALPEAPAAEETTFVDVIHQDISRGIIATASWFDSFFYDPRYEVEENRTRLILREDAYLERGDHWDISTHVKIKLVLPWLKNKAHLIIAGDPDEQTATEGILADTAATQTVESATKQRNTSGSIGYYFKSDDKRNISLRTGLRYRSGKVVFFTRPHYRVLYNIGTWNLRFTQEFPYWSDTKWQSQTAIDLERKLSEKYFFRASLYGSWQEGVAGYSYSTIVVLQRTLGSTSALAYEWVNSFVTRPHHILSQVVFDVRYRRQVWRTWMYFEVAPGIKFADEDDWKFTPNIMFRLEMTFGKT